MQTFVFRVVVDTEEDIFRDIEVAGDQNFEDLHDAIVHAFDFAGDQMASFYMSNDQWEKGKEIGLMDVSHFEGDDSFPSMKNTLITDEVIDKNQKILYVYDFLKMWIFYVELVQINEISSEVTYPAIIREFGEAPDENSKKVDDLLAGVDLSGKHDDFDDDVDDDGVDYGDDDFDDEGYLKEEVKSQYEDEHADVDYLSENDNYDE